MTKLTFALCSYNRADRLKKLLPIMRQQECPIPFEILVIDNNSTDNTHDVVMSLVSESGVPIRYVHEPVQGIPYARNRAIEESLNSEILVFIDDDEIPLPGLLAGAVDAIENEQADCAGGRVNVLFQPGQRPQWLGDEFLGFLAEVAHGMESFWITDRSTPIWTANVAYKTEIFKKNPGLRFDFRYNRKGNQVGGGSDAVMFWALLEGEYRIRYRPDMAVDHFVDDWRLKRLYFLKLHFVAGRKFGQFQTGDYQRELCGVPMFMMSKLFKEWGKAAALFVTGKQTLRQGMNGAYALGCIWGRILRWRSDG